MSIPVGEKPLAARRVPPLARWEAKILHFNGRLKPSHAGKRGLERVAPPGDLGEAGRVWLETGLGGWRKRGVQQPRRSY